MKKVNDGARVSSEARASYASKNLVGPDMSVDMKTTAAAASDETGNGLLMEPAKPKINKKSKSRPRLEDAAATTRSKLSSRSMLIDSQDAADYSLVNSAEGQTTSIASRYRPVGERGDRIAIFIDGSNLFYAASHLSIEVDYRRLLTTLVGDRRLLRAYFYTGVDPQNEKQRGFLLWLNRHGHRVVSKELTNMPDGSRKANMHVEMAVDMMRIAEHCPTITLLGGDGNLAYALEALSQRGVSLEVVSLQSMTSDSLIDLADSYVDLADLRDEIKR